MAWRNITASAAVAVVRRSSEGIFSRPLLRRLKLRIAYDTVRIFDADSENSHHPQKSRGNSHVTSMSRLGKALGRAPQSRSSELRSRWLLLVRRESVLHTWR